LGLTELDSANDWGFTPTRWNRLPFTINAEAANSRVWSRRRYCQPRETLRSVLERKRSHDQEFQNMHRRNRAFRDFVRHLIRNVLFVREVLAGLLTLLVLGGVAISFLEQLPLGQSVYFAFITGLTIGYGDVVPQTALGQLVSVVIGTIGMIFTGITVAVSTRALADATAERIEHDD